MINNWTKEITIWVVKRGEPIRSRLLKNWGGNLTSTWSRISSRKVFNFLLYWQSIILQDILFFILIIFGDLFLNWLSTCTRINSQKSKAYKFERNYIMHCQRAKKSDEHGMSFQSSLKITRTLNTRLIWVQWKFTTPNHYFI